MAAAVIDLEVEAGADWDVDFTVHAELEDGSQGDLIPIDGYQFTLEVRDNSSTTNDVSLWTASTEPQGPIDPELVIADVGKLTLHADGSRTVTLPQTGWSTARDSDAKHHYTLRAVSPVGEDRFVATGLLTINVA